METLEHDWNKDVDFTLFGMPVYQVHLIGMWRKVCGVSREADGTGECGLSGHELPSGRFSLFKNLC